MDLCEGIKISRYRHDFVRYMKLIFREEHLYSVLIDMMRSPEILKMITKSTLQYLMDKNDDENKTESKENNLQIMKLKKNE